MNNLPEPHRAIEVSEDNWVWPDVETLEVNNRQMFCTDVFRATGTTFVRVVEMKHLEDYEARRYVAGEFFTAAEWAEMMA